MQIATEIAYGTRAKNVKLHIFWFLEVFKAGTSKDFYMLPLCNSIAASFQVNNLTYCSETIKHCSLDFQDTSNS